MDYLVFRLYGPLASWGQAAVGGDRPTGIYPSRSAIVGLLAAALGVRRSEEERQVQLNASVVIGVKQLVPSSLLRDYHTAQVPPTRRNVRHLTRKSELEADKLNTILSSRDYRCDGLWVVAVRLSAESVYSLDELQEALLKPKFTLYLGRKSCPLALPLAPRIETDVGLKEALDAEFLPLTRSAKEDALWLSGNNRVTYFWEGEKNALGIEGTIMTTQPWDNPLSRTRWQFNQQTVHQISVRESDNVSI